MINQSSTFFSLRCKDIYLVVLVFILVAFCSFLYTRTLPGFMPQDEYVILLANKCAVTQSFPQCDMLLNYNYGNYIYYNLIESLTNNFPIEIYRTWILFSYVFLLGLCCYFALRSIKISRAVSLVTSIVALFPRLSIGSTFFGVFTNKENLGRSIVFPLIWIIFCWHLKRLQDKKEIWPVFLVIGLGSYFHPVTMVFLAGLLLLVTLVHHFIDKEWFFGIKQFMKGLVAFCLGASSLLFEIYQRTRVIAGGFVSRIDYSTAIEFRLGWEFPPDNLVWFKAISVFCVFFIIVILFAIYKRNVGNIVDYIKINITARWVILVVILSTSLSILLPFIQLQAMRHLGSPLLIQQTSRIFIFFYPALFIAFAISLDYLFKNIQILKRFKVFSLALVLLFGIISSNIGSEWLQYLSKKGAYDPGYIPLTIQGSNDVNDFDFYPNICNELRKLGADSNSKIITDDGLRLLYFCEIPLHVTWQDGAAYLNKGRSEFVTWYKRYLEQTNILESGDIEVLKVYMKSNGVKFIVVSSKNTVSKILKSPDFKVIQSGDRLVATLLK